MRIKEESIREVLDSADIVSVVGEYVNLKPSGRNYVALCPFHKEKTPSFTVSRDKGLFFCFGCKIGGNVISFLTKYSGLSYVDAIETLAKKFGVKLQYEGGLNREEDKELEQFYEYSLITAEYFHNNLLETNEGKKALKYLKDRGIEEATIKAFKIGYALSAWNGLFNFIKRNNYELEPFEKLSLIIKKENGEFYDRFRGRIIFPIFSSIGRVIAFGGRILEEDKDQPKYMNSAESRIYIKGKNLYGLFQTKDEIRKKQSAILVEGYMDFLSLYQNGVKNVVAAAGTSLTLDQIFILSKVAQNINLVFDGDDAGTKAAIRSIELMLQSDIDFKIISLPDNEDPDSFIKKFGKNSLIDLIDKGKNYIDYIYELAEKRNLLNDPQSKVKVINSILEFTSRVRDPIRREILAREIAKKFNVTDSAIIQKLNGYVKSYTKTEEKQIKYQNNLDTQPIDEKIVDEVSPLEKGILKLICDVEPTHLEQIFSEIDENDFPNPSAGEIFRLLKQHYLDKSDRSKIDVKLIMNNLENEELRSIFSNALIERYKISDGWIEVEDYSRQKENYFKDIITDYKNKLRKIAKQKRIETLIKKNINDTEEAKKYLEIIESLIKQKKN